MKNFKSSELLLDFHYFTAFFKSQKWLVGISSLPSLDKIDKSYNVDYQFFVIDSNKNHQN